MRPAAPSTTRPRSSGHLNVLGGAQIWPPCDPGRREPRRSGVSVTPRTIKPTRRGGVHFTTVDGALPLVHDTKGREASAGGRWYLHAITPAGAIDTKTPSANPPHPPPRRYTTLHYTTRHTRCLADRALRRATTNDCATTRGNGCM